jgi:hypothetical protein
MAWHACKSLKKKGIKIAQGCKGLSSTHRITASLHYHSIMHHYDKPGVEKREAQVHENAKMQFGQNVAWHLFAPAVGSPPRHVDAASAGCRPGVTSRNRVTGQRPPTCVCRRLVAMMHLEL